MDAPYKSKTRKFPAYTTAQLKKAAAEGVTETRSAAQLAEIKAEIARRESGQSKPFATPQI